MSNNEKNINSVIGQEPEDPVDIRYLKRVTDKPRKYEEKINSKTDKVTKPFHRIQRGLINKKEISTKIKMSCHLLYLVKLMTGTYRKVKEKKLQIAEMKEQQ